MWRCGECGFWNDEGRERCQHCESARAAAEDASRGADRAGEVGAAPRRRFSAIEWAALAVVVASVAALVLLGLYAWQRGLIKLPLLGPAPTPSEGTSASVDSGAALEPGSLPEDHPLSVIYQASARGLKRFERYADKLLAAEGRLGAWAAPHPPPGGLDEEARRFLEEAAALGSELLALHAEFEEDCLRHGTGELESFLELLRSQFMLRLQDALVLIGEVYTYDTVGEHPAYLLSDGAATAAEQFSPRDAALLRLTWSEAVHNRTQYLLDLELEEEYKQCYARLEALREVHRGFERSQSQLGPYKIRSGSLAKSARDTLELLDGLADSVEEFAVEFDEYREALGDKQLSDKLKSTINSFEDLAQRDHLYAFTEIYRIYAQDRNLTHPVYQRLAEHYAFVEQYWPAVAPTYRRIYTQYEAEWTALWAD